MEEKEERKRAEQERQRLEDEREAERVRKEQVRLFGHLDPFLDTWTPLPPASVLSPNKHLQTPAVGRCHLHPTGKAQGSV